MTRKAKSIRGEVVDFDLAEIKNKILNSPTPDVVQQRERFIDKRRRRSSRKKIDEMMLQQEQNESAVRIAMKEAKAQMTEENDVVILPDISLTDSVAEDTLDTSEVSNVSDDATKQKRKIVKAG
jgi:predicted homoserine dehydrogenase-like protein